MMIGKQIKGTGFKRCLNYVLGKKGAYLIGGTMCGQTPEELAAEASDRPTTKTKPESSSFSRLFICRSHQKTVHRGTGTQRQELRRHKKLDILMIYDDNRGLDRQDISQMLDGMF